MIMDDDCFIVCCDINGYELNGWFMVCCDVNVRIIFLGFLKVE